MPSLRSKNLLFYRNCKFQSFQYAMNFRTLIFHISQADFKFFYASQKHAPQKRTAKRVSRPASDRGRVENSMEASMTVEASLAVPLFLFFMVNVLSCLLFFHTFLSNLEHLHQQGRQLSMMAYMAGDSGLIRDDMVQLVHPERISPVVPILGYPGTTIVSCCYMRAWTGYDVEHRAEGGEGEETYVYITDGGSAYHMARNCTHLTLSITLAGKEEMETLRNASGGRYRPCERCGGDGSGIVYITKEGDRYHNTIECSGLKRSVRCIPISEAVGRTPCSRCCA